MKFNMRFWMLVLLILISMWYLFSYIFLQTLGVGVGLIDENAKCGSLKVGDLITEVEGQLINNKQDFDAASKYVVKDRPMTLVINGRPGRCTALNDGELGIQVVDVGSKGLRFGVDLVGGDKVLVASDSNFSLGEVSYISNVLEKRLKVVGQQDSRVSVDGNSIAIYAPAGNNIELILAHGNLEGVIEQELKLTNGSAKVKVGDTSQEIFWNGSNGTVGGERYGISELFNIKGVQFKVANATNESVVVDAVILDNSNIATIEGSIGYVKYDANSGQYQFNAPVEVKEAGGEKFSEITKGLIPLYGEDRSLLNGLLVYRLDNKEITRLSIPSDMAGTSIKSISIVGGVGSMEEAVNKKMSVEMALAGNIEKTLHVKTIEGFSGSLNWIILFGEAALTSVMVIIFLFGLARYKKLKVGIFGSLILGLEVTYIFGIVSISQSLLAPGWIMDAASLIGVCVFSIVSAIQIILLSEKFLKGRIIKRYNYFVFAVFVLGLILLFTPLSRIGLVLIAGCLVGSLLTKPVYTDILSGYR